MSEYIDPNSGAAPQPGGYAGPGAVAEGHGSVPPGFQTNDDGGLDPVEAPATPGDTFALVEAQRAAAERDKEAAEAAEAAEAEESDEPAQEEAAPNPEPEPEPEPEPNPEPEGEGDEGSAEEGDESVDYSELLDGTVPDVVAYMDEHPDEREAVVQAERDRAAAAEKEPRKGITGNE